MEFPNNPYSISIVLSTEGGDDSAFSAFDKGCKLTAEQIINFLKKHSASCLTSEQYFEEHGNTSGIGIYPTRVLKIKESDWQELLSFCK